MKIYTDNNFVAFEDGDETLLIPLGLTSFDRNGDYFEIFDHVHGSDNTYLHSQILDQDGNPLADADAVEAHLESSME